MNVVGRIVAIGYLDVLFSHHAQHMWMIATTLLIQHNLAGWIEAEFVHRAAALDIDEYVREFAILYHYILGGLVRCRADAHRILAHVDWLRSWRGTREQNLPRYSPFVAR